MKKFISISLLSAILLTACQPEEVKIEAPVPPPLVEVLDLAEEPSYLVNEVGTIKASSEVELVSDVTGIVEDLFIEVGDSISLDQRMALIDFKEVHDSSQINYDNTQLQLSNAEETLDEKEANNQASVMQAEIRVESLADTLKRLRRNLSELRAQNESTQLSLELQKSNAIQQSENSDLSYENLVSQYNQSQDDLLINTKSSLDNILFDIKINFQSVEDFINPDNVDDFGVNNMNEWLGEKKSSQKAALAVDYRTIRDDLDKAVDKLEEMSPLTQGNVNVAISLVEREVSKFKEFFEEVRVFLNHSTVNDELTQSMLDGYTSVNTGAEAAMLANAAQLNSLSQSLAAFDLDETSQLTSNENSVTISENQVAEANNALLNFFDTSLASEQDLEAQIEQTENDLQAAQIDLESAKRNEIIQNSGANLDLDLLDNQLKLAENELDRDEITSSAEGIVSELSVDQGDHVSPGTTMAKIIRTDEVNIVFYLSKEHSDQLSIGQTFEFYVSADRDESFEAKITTIAPALDAGNKKLMIEASADNPDQYLKPEMFVDIELNLSETTFKPSTIYIPINAIIFGQNEQYVYVVENEMIVEPVDVVKRASVNWLRQADPFKIYDLAEAALWWDEVDPSYQVETTFAIKTPIEIGETFNSWVEVEDGLSFNDVLIVEGHRGLEDKKQITVLNEMME